LSIFITVKKHCNKELPTFEQLLEDNVSDCSPTELKDRLIELGKDSMKKKPEKGKRNVNRKILTDAVAVRKLTFILYDIHVFYITSISLIHTKIKMHVSFSFLCLIP